MGAGFPQPGNSHTPVGVYAPLAVIVCVCLVFFAIGMRARAAAAHAVRV